MATVRERFRKDGSKVFQVKIRLRGQKPTTMTFKRKLMLRSGSKILNQQFVKEGILRNPNLEDTL